MNAHLLDAGWKEPRAVPACASGALSFHLLAEPEIEEVVAASGLEVLHPEFQTRPRVYYRSLYRFTRAFIAGTVTSAREGVEECAAGTGVALFRGEEKIQETTSDVFGDFKFDDLPEGSGHYRVQVARPSESPVSRDVLLEMSTYLGVIRV